MNFEINSHATTLQSCIIDAWGDFEVDSDTGVLQRTDFLNRFMEYVHEATCSETVFRFNVLTTALVEASLETGSNIRVHESLL